MHGYYNCYGHFSYETYYSCYGHFSYASGRARLNYSPSTDWLSRPTNNYLFFLNVVQMVKDNHNWPKCQIIWLFFDKIQHLDVENKIWLLAEAKKLTRFGSTHVPNNKTNPESLQVIFLDKIISPSLPGVLCNFINSSLPSTLNNFNIFLTAQIWNWRRQFYYNVTIWIWLGSQSACSRLIIV